MEVTASRAPKKSVLANPAAIPQQAAKANDKDASDAVPNRRTGTWEAGLPVGSTASGRDAGNFGTSAIGGLARAPQPSGVPKPPQRSLRAICLSISLARMMSPLPLD